MAELPHHKENQDKASIPQASEHISTAIDNTLPTNKYANPHVKKLFGKGIEITDIHQGDKIPIGGVIFRDDHSTFVEADIDSFSDFYEKVEKNALKFSKDEAFIQRIQQINDRIDPVLFAHMYSFSKVYEKIYKNVRTKGFNGAERMAYYDQHPDAKLSDIVGGGMEQCAEICVLCQGYFNKVGIRSKYIGGEVVRGDVGEDEDYGEAHSYILLEDKGESIIYDPTNPIDTNMGEMPRIQTSAFNFTKILTSGNKAFVQTTNIMGGEKAYYGIGDGTVIWKDQHVIGEL